MSGGCKACAHTMHYCWSLASLLEPGSNASCTALQCMLPKKGLPALLTALPTLRLPAGALYATMPLVRTRGQLTTFQNLQQPVQQLSGRQFTVGGAQAA